MLSLGSKALFSRSVCKEAFVGRLSLELFSFMCSDMLPLVQSVTGLVLTSKEEQALIFLGVRLECFANPRQNLLPGLHRYHWMLSIISPKEHKVECLDFLRSGSTRKRVFETTREWLANFRPHPVFQRFSMKCPQPEHSMYRNTGISPYHLEENMRPHLDGSDRSHGQCRS